MIKKGKAIRIIALFIIVASFLISDLSRSGFANETLPDDEDLNAELFCSMDFDSSEITGSGDIMGLGTYEPHKPSKWYEEPELDTGTTEFEMSEMQFSNIHSNLNEETPQANFTLEGYGGNFTCNTTETPEYEVAAGNITTIKLSTLYNYTYPNQDILSYATTTGTDNDVATSALSDVDGTTLDLKTTGDYDMEVSNYPPTYTWGSGSGTLSDMNTNNGVYYTVSSYQYPSYHKDDFGVDRAYKSDGSDIDDGEDEDDWSEDDDNDYAYIKVYDDSSRFHAYGWMYIRGTISSSYWDRSDWKYGQDEIQYSIDMDTNNFGDDPNTDDWYLDESKINIYVSNDDSFGGTYCKIYGRTDTTGDGGMDEVDGSYVVSDLDNYINSESHIYIIVLVELTGHACDAVFSSGYIKGELDEVDIVRDGRSLLNAEVDYPDTSDGFSLTYDINAICTGTPTYFFFDIGGSRVQLSSGENFGTENTAGSGDSFNIYYMSIYSTLTLQIDMLLCYNRAYDDDINTVIEFDNTNRASVDDVYNFTMYYKSDTSEDYFLLQYGDSSKDEWHDMGYLTSTTYTRYSRLVSYNEPDFRIYGKEYSYTYPEIDYFNLYIDEVNMTTKLVPFDNVWLNITYEVSGVVYNENISMSFAGYEFYNWTHGNLSYIVTSRDFKHYSSILTIIVLEQYMNITYHLPITMDITINFTILYSSVEWEESTAIDFTANDEDVLPSSPNSGWINFYEYQDTIEFEADADKDIGFALSVSNSFSFTIELEITSRRVLRKMFTLISDHAITIDRIDFDPDIDPLGVWLEGIEYPSPSGAGNHTVHTDRVMEPGETFELIVYLSTDIYKEFEYFFDYLGSGTYDVYMLATTSNPFFDDKTKDYDWRITLPTGFTLENMDLGFSDMSYLEDYSSYELNNTYGYGYDTSSYTEESVNRDTYYYNTRLNGTKLDESLNSGNMDVYEENFDETNGNMSHSYSTDGYSSTYDVDGNMFMQNQFPTQDSTEGFGDLDLNNNSDYTTSYTNNTLVYDSTIVLSGLGKVKDVFIDGDSNYAIGDDYEFRRYDSDWNLVGQVTLDGVEQPISNIFRGIVKKDGYWYMCALNDPDHYNCVYKMVETSTLHFDVITHYNPQYATSSCEDLWWNGTYWFMAITGTGKLYYYDENFVYVGQYNFENYLQGFVQKNNYKYMAGIVGGSSCIKQYNQNMVLTGYTINPGASPVGLYEYGSKLYLSCDTDDIKVYNIILNIDSSLKTGSSSTAPVSSSMTYYNGSLTTSGDLASVDNNYYSFNSTNSVFPAGVPDGVYHLNEGGAGTATEDDGSGTDADGTLSSSALWSASSKLGANGAYCTAVTNYVDMGNVYSFGRYNAFSFDLWFKLEADITSGSNRLVSKLKSGYSYKGYAVNLQYQDASNLQFELYMARGSGSASKRTVVRWLGQTETDLYDKWNHLVFTYSGSGNAAGCKFYRNGVLQTPTVYADDLDAEITNSDSFHICADADNNEGTIGYYDEVCVYSYEMSQAQINLRYNSGSGTESHAHDYLNINIAKQLTGVYSNDTIETVHVHHAYRLNQFNKYVSTKISAYNFATSSWTTVNESIYTGTTFYDIQYTLSSDYINSTRHFRIKIDMSNSSKIFQLQLDLLRVDITYTKTSGEINATLSKSIDFAFLNRYDSYHYYRYNVTIQFQYKFTNSSNYDNITEFLIDNCNYSLLQNNKWNTMTVNFIFDSFSVNSFIVGFNLSNGRLQLKDMNYTIINELFNETDGNNYMYQYFRYDAELSLNYLQRTRGNWILNFTYNFNATTYTWYNFYNSLRCNNLNNSYLVFRLWIQDEVGWTNACNYTTNISTVGDVNFSYNITHYLANISRSNLLDFYLEFYLAGNPSNMSLDDIVLYDYDDDFYLVQYLWIDDNMLLPTQDTNIYWKIIEEYPLNVIVNGSFENGTIITYFDVALLNDTFQSLNYNNYSAGFYSLNFTFYDQMDNRELWTLNYTLVPDISIFVGYENPILTNITSNFSVSIFSQSIITQIYYENGTDYIQQYNNEEYPLYDNIFNISVTFSNRTTYNISVLVVDIYNNNYNFNITGLCAIERTSQVDIINLKGSYYQDERMNVEISLRDLFNQPISNKVVNYTFQSPNGSYYIMSSNTTQEDGIFNIAYNLTLLWASGFHHLNVSFVDNTSSYVGCWKMISFEVLPITHYITDASDAGLTVSGACVGSDNVIPFNTTNFNSFDLDIDNEGSLSFDLTIENCTIIYNRTNNYQDTLEFDFTAELGLTPFTSMTITFANLSDIPNNFTYLYLNNLRTTDYTMTTGIYHDLSLDCIINTTLTNNEGFNIMLRYTQLLQRVYQITELPRTDVNSVLFNESFMADFTNYRHFYFKSNVYINEIISFEHLRTSALYDDDDFIRSGEKYFIQLQNKTITEDVFEAILDFDPDWDISYDIISNNGTYCEVEIEYKADLAIDNVTLCLSLSSESLFMENWSMNAIEDEYFNIEIPNLNFTTTSQTLTIIGSASTPHADFSEYASEYLIIVTKDSRIHFNGYISYPAPGTSYFLPVASDWELDGVHYGDIYYNIEDNGYFATEDDMLGPGITTSYLDFYAYPITETTETVETLKDGTAVLTVKIKSSLPITHAAYPIEFDSTEKYELALKEGGDEHTSVKQIQGEWYILDFEIEDGTTEIKIAIKYTNALQNFMLMLPILAVVGAAIGVYIYRKKRYVLTQIKSESQARIEQAAEGLKRIFNLENINYGLKKSNEILSKSISKRKRKDKKKQYNRKRKGEL